MKNYLLAALLLFVSPLVWSGEETPLTFEGGTIVAPDEAYNLLKGGRALFFDVRSALNYGRGHVAGARFAPFKGNPIKNSLSIPDSSTFDAAGLNDDKSVPIVIYSHGTTGWKSYKAALAAVAADYENVMWMREGFSAWQASGYPVE